MHGPVRSAYLAPDGLEETLAQSLALPQEVITALPTGDTHDGRVDTEVFGAPYEFVELYLNWRCLGETQQQTELAALPPAEQATFQKLAANLEALHRHNAHKFRVGSPAVHLNLLMSAVPGGWKH